MYGSFWCDRLESYRERRRAREQRVEVRDVLHQNRAPALRRDVRERRLEPRQRRPRTRPRRRSLAHVPLAERARRVREDTTPLPLFPGERHAHARPEPRVDVRSRRLEQRVAPRVPRGPSALPALLARPVDRALRRDTRAAMSRGSVDSRVRAAPSSSPPPSPRRPRAPTRPRALRPTYLVRGPQERGAPGSVYCVPPRSMSITYM